MLAPAVKQSAFVVLAAAFGIAASQSWVDSRPDRCPQPSAASIEMLFAPCLAATPAVSPDLLKFEFPPPGAIPPPSPSVREPARERDGRDIDATSSIRTR